MKLFKSLLSLFIKSVALLMFFITTAISLKAQTCSSISQIPPNGNITVNGVNITSVSTGATTVYPNPLGPICGVSIGANSLLVGYVASPDNSSSGATPASAFSVTLTFDKPVNDLLFVIVAGGTNTINGSSESYTFNTNGGTPTVTITPNAGNTRGCLTTVSGTTVTQSNGGTGYATIHAASPFTSITINGPGGYGGTAIGVCAASIASFPSITSITPSSQTVCTNASPTNIQVTATDATSYQWYSNAVNSNSGGTLISGATSTSYTPPTNTAGTMYYYVVVTNSAGSVTSSTVSVTVNNCSVPPSISSITPASQTVCINDAPTNITVAATGTAPLTYQWYSNTVNSNSGGTLISGATSTSYTPPTNAAGTKYYYVIVTNGSGNANSNAVSVTTNQGAMCCKAGSTAPVTN